MPSHHQQDSGSTATDLAKGALAGAAAVWAMDRLDWFLFTHEDPAARRRTERARPDGLDPAHLLANRVAGALGKRLSPPQPHPAGVAVHYAIGVGPAALYAATRDMAPGLGRMGGPLLGLTLFLAQDEVGNPLMGLSAKPGRYPWQAHARGLAAHLAFGIVTDLALDALDALAPRNRKLPGSRAPGRMPARARHDNSRSP